MASSSKRILVTPTNLLEVREFTNINIGDELMPVLVLHVSIIRGVS